MIKDNKNELVEVKKGSIGKGLLIEHDGYISMLEGDNKKLNESINSNGEWHVPYPFIVSAVFQKYGIKNANGRIYPENILKREVAKYQERIDKRNALGELDHPQEATIALDRISHNIIELHWVGRTLVGKLELNVSQGFIKHGICSTMGDMAANLLMNGYKIGVSSRAVGSVEKDRMGNLVVGDDLEILCWDVVCDPSTPNAYIGSSEEELTPYFESIEKNDNTILSEKINKIKNILLN